MVFYALGSLLFLFALVGALGVIAVNLRHYRTQMMTALRGLSLDGIVVRTPGEPTAPTRTVRIRPARAAA